MAERIAQARITMVAVAKRFTLVPSFCLRTWPRAFIERWGRMDLIAILRRSYRGRQRAGGLESWRSTSVCGARQLAEAPEGQKRSDYDLCRMDPEPHVCASFGDQASP